MSRTREHPVYNKYICHDDGKIFSTIKNKFVKQSNTGNGYLSFCAYVGDGSSKFKMCLSHRFITEAFYGISKLTVNHKDGDKKNNNVENLEWSTYSQNVKHSFDKKLHVPARGESRYNSKHTEMEILSVITMLNAGFSTIEIEKFGVVSKSVAYSVFSGRNWSHLSYLKTVKPPYVKKQTL